MANVISDDTIEYVGILAKLELSPEEKEEAKETVKEEKKEQAALLKEYIESIRGNMRGQLNSILIKEKDGSITDLGKKYGGVTDTKN